MAAHALVVALALFVPQTGGGTVRVSDVAGLREAVARAKPGISILLEPGDYRGGLHLTGIRGAAGRPVVIGAVDPKNPPRIVGGGSGLQLSAISHVEVRDLVLIGATGNGLNIDDGGVRGTPSRHVRVRNIRVADLPQGNHDGIKLSGLDDFTVENCTVERWGGSGIDMVGCHRGLIVKCTFRSGGDSGIQAKGGSSEVTIRSSRFEHAGRRGVNVGGSTGLEFFRPPVSSMPPKSRYEAKDIRVEGCTFIGGDAALAFVGVDGAAVRFNTIYRPNRWALRILQETRAEGFVPTRDVTVEDNLVVFRVRQWFEGGVNIGSGTAPETFRFARNFWFCEDDPARSRPSLPSAETQGIYGRDPLLESPETGNFGVRAGSPARGRGAHALPQIR